MNIDPAAIAKAMLDEAEARKQRPVSLDEALRPALAKKWGNPASTSGTPATGTLDAAVAQHYAAKASDQGQP